MPSENFKNAQKHLAEVTLDPSKTLDEKVLENLYMFGLHLRLFPESLYERLNTSCRPSIRR